jgi:hypothetical protein
VNYWCGIVVRHKAPDWSAPLGVTVHDWFARETVPALALVHVFWMTMSPGAAALATSRHSPECTLVIRPFVASITNCKFAFLHLDGCARAISTRKQSTQVPATVLQLGTLISTGPCMIKCEVGPEVGEGNSHRWAEADWLQVSMLSLGFGGGGGTGGGEGGPGPGAGCFPHAPSM